MTNKYVDWDIDKVRSRLATHKRIRKKRQEEGNLVLDVAHTKCIEELEEELRKRQEDIIDGLPEDVSTASLEDLENWISYHQKLYERHRKDDNQPRANLHKIRTQELQEAVQTKKEMGQSYKNLIKRLEWEDNFGNQYTHHEP